MISDTSVAFALAEALTPEVSLLLVVVADCIFSYIGTAFYDVGLFHSTLHIHTHLTNPTHSLVCATNCSLCCGLMQLEIP